jgi:hypothetical protein
MQHVLTLKTEHYLSNHQVVKMLMAERQTDKHVGLRHAGKQAHMLAARHTCKHARTHDLTHTRLYAKVQAGMLTC